MRPFCLDSAFLMTVGILLGNCAFLFAADENKVLEKARTESDMQMKRWIDQLGSERFENREKATQQLSKLGKSALPSLKAAIKSRDAEVRHRAQQLIERIEQPSVRPTDNLPEQPAPLKIYL